jgi:dephospho-CoA kinase
LIVDIGVSGFFDIVVLVTADDGVRLSRLLEKRGMTEKEARARIASQVPDSERRKNSGIVIENDGSIEQLRSKVREAWEEIGQRSGGFHS